jgi:Autophagy protein ATG9
LLTTSLSLLSHSVQDPLIENQHHLTHHAALQVQRNLRLCIKRDLTEHDIVSRIMRKDNYLIGALVSQMALYQRSAAMAFEITSQSGSRE